MIKINDDELEELINSCDEVYDRIKKEYIILDKDDELPIYFR